MKLKKLLVVTGLLIFIFGVGYSWGEIYTWVDKDGITHIQDNPPNGQSNLKKIENTENNNKSVSEASKESSQNSAKNNLRDKLVKASLQNIEIYTTSWCPYCKKAKEYLNSKGISYTEYDVEKDPEAMRRKNELAPGGGVPVAVVNGRIVKGFSKETYDSIFNGKP